MKQMKQYKMNSMLGPLYLVASDKGLRGLYFKKQNLSVLGRLDLTEPEDQILKQTHAELEDYFAGKRHDFTVPLDLEGTEFQVRVWKELLKIPYGKTRSYRDIARKIKNEKAVRAVGTANGKNPICVIVPCHRVIAADGTLGGYSGGLGLKTQLLSLEEQHS